MSADNWAICPRCKERAEKAYQKLQDRVESDYGKITAPKYLALVREAAQPLDLEPLRTFSEYTEIGIVGGDFEVSYSGSCKECGLSHKFNYEEVLRL